ncbi:MAG: 16S rRNA (cytosine(1402)-N(4))-methyltransferase RsmH [Spirochaetia bacterium]|nr:16S rRNA (cytosine(1402)-N(4))-methyltransferase RsmH [Spirochaetia bacterium]
MYRPVHRPVMAEEVLELLVPPEPDSLMVDSTTGEGGHTSLFLKRYPYLSVIALDADSRIQEKAKERLAPYADRIRFVHTWFDDFYTAYPYERRPDLILFDLGISVFHYERSGGGFSFLKEEPLDMRLDTGEGFPVLDWILRNGEKELADCIFSYGEERYSRLIATALFSAARNGQLTDAKAAAEVIYRAVPAAYRQGHLHPATKTFQALRIAVNDELGRLERALTGAFSVLNPGGILGVISFHSLEDRIVKRFMKTKSGGGRRSYNKYRLEETAESATGELLTAKPLTASSAEIAENAPSRSAKLRVIRKKTDEIR